MTWGFIWLMFVLKIPIFGLFGIVWWAVRQDGSPRGGEPARVPGGGLGSPAPSPHPRSRVPRPRRPRGPHGDPLPLPPARVRRVSAIGRQRAGR